jgi:hypothetical protein
MVAIVKKGPSGVACITAVTQNVKNNSVADEHEEINGRIAVHLSFSFYSALMPTGPGFPSLRRRLSSRQG